MTRVSLDQLSYATFAGLVNSRFRVESDPAPAVELTLLEATLARASGAADLAESGRENFSLSFRGPADRFLPQRIYLFSHDQLGAFDLFIVPVGREADGYRYEAVFNRLVAHPK